MMLAKEFYDKRLKEDPTIGSVQLMEEYAKHIIQINFCDGAPTNFDSMTIAQIKSANKKMNDLVDWINE